MKRRGDAALALDGPPPVTLGLRRFVLRSVGPPAARFHPLDLDLVCDDGSVARRALCLLTNTGGKSTLLKLLSAVVNPGTAGLIGKGEVADMVLATDTSHVVLEWQQADGTRYVTGWTAQWDGLQKPPSGTKGLRQCWYFFRSNGIGVDDLPFEHEGRRVRWEEYRRQLRALFSEHPAGAGYVADTQVDWSRTLDARTRIDAELFRYQATMNAAEAGAAALVTRLKTPEAFVGFFVSAFDDDALTATLFREVAAYTAQAGNRSSMEVHATLCGELIGALGGFAAADADFGAAVEMEIGDVQLRRELAGQVRARAAAEAVRERETGLALAAETERLVAANRAIDGDESRRKQYVFLEAEMRTEAARKAESAAVEAEREADRQRLAWAAVPAVVAHDAATTRLREAQTAFDAAQIELAPLRARVSEAASRLVASLRSRAVAAGAAAAAAGHRARTSKEASGRATARREAALTAAAGLRHDLQAADERSARAVRLLADARQRGDAGPGETAAAAAARWSGAQAKASEDRRRAADARKRAASAQRSAVDERSAGQIALRDARSAAAAAGEGLANAASSALALLDAPDVAVVIGAPAEGLPRHRAVPAAVALAAAATVDEQAEVVERSARETATNLHAVEAELGRLSEGTAGLLDVGAEVASAVSVLRGASIGAVPGWHWIEGTVLADDRPAFIAARPDIANGVVVMDAAKLEAARTTLEKAGLFPRIAVAVTTSRAATATADSLPAPEEDDRFVVEPHPGLYDKDKAREEIERLQEAQATLAQILEEQVARGRELRESVGLARRHAEAWPDACLDALESGLAEAEGDAVAAEQRIDAAGAVLQTAAQEEQDATDAERLADDAEQAAVAARLRLSPVIDAEAAVAADALERPGIVEQIARHDRAAAEAAEEAETESVAAEVAAAEQRESEQVARASTERAAQIGEDPAPTVPAEAVHVLEAEYDEAARRFEDESAGRDHGEALKRAEEELLRTGAGLTGNSEETLAHARSHSASVLAGTAEAVRAQIAASAEAWKAANDRKSQRRRDVERWEELANTHRPLDRPAHAALAPDEVPTDADDAALRAADLNRALVGARAGRDAQQVAVATAEAAHVAATRAASDFAAAVIGGDDPLGGADPYVGDVDAARRDLEARRGAVDYARQFLAEARLERERAAGAVNTRANNRRWADIGDSLKELCAVAGPDDLSAHGGRYLAGLRTREESLRSDIADLDTHRSAVIDSLGQTCDRLRRNLHAVRGASTIPTQVANVGGHQAIVIEFKRLPAEAANAALASVVDEWAATSADVRDAKVRQTRLMQALSATVENRPQAGRWSVRLLKPRIDGDVTYCAPDRVSKEYSGGQELTLAVLLYCALAKVRSDDRTGNDRPPGLLLLDNPFGAASNERLIEMWQKLAEAADVQLLCFTALGEPSILNGFNGPGTFRQVLRNDRDQRNGHQHVRAVAAEGRVVHLVQAHLAGPDLESGEESRVGGVGYQTKPTFPAEPPESPPGVEA